MYTITLITTDDGSPSSNDDFMKQKKKQTELENIHNYINT